MSLKKELYETEQVSFTSAEEWKVLALTEKSWVSPEEQDITYCTWWCEVRLWFYCVRSSPVAGWLSPPVWRTWCCCFLDCHTSIWSVLGSPLYLSLTQIRILWWSEGRKENGLTHENGLRECKDLTDFLFLIIKQHCINQYYSESSMK